MTNGLRRRKPKSEDARPQDASGSLMLRRVNALKKSFIKAKVNMQKPPNEIESRTEGIVSSAVQIDAESLRFTVWQDGGGKKVVARRINNKRVSDSTLGEQLLALFSGDLQDIENGNPARLILELRPDESHADILKEIDSIDPSLVAKVELIGGYASGSTYANWRKNLEENSSNRVTNNAYLNILTLLDKASQLENMIPVTLRILQKQLDILEQLSREIPFAQSQSDKKKDNRNSAIAHLQKEINNHRDVIIRQKVQLLRQIENEIKDHGVAKRTPSEVLVHFLHSIRAAQKDNPNSETLNTLERQVKQIILKHEMTLSNTQRLLSEAQATLLKENFSQLAALATTLTNHLPENEAALAPTRLHDNVYGRVLDSAIVLELVKNPPPQVISSMKSAAKAMADILRGTPPSQESKEQIAQEMQDNINKKNPRFWMPLVPSLKALATADTPQTKIDALLAFLDNPGDSGHATIAIPYVLVKTAAVLQHKATTPWMVEAGTNYGRVITDQTRRIDAPRTDFEPGKFRFAEVIQEPKLGAGITLKFQSNPFVEPGTVESTRPTVKNMPNFEKDLNLSVQAPPRMGALEQTRFPSAAIETALQSGLPYASGVSGSTNIMLHLLKHMKSPPNNANVDPKTYLLGTMMFLVYDGGHSIQEVLWTANQLDKQLGLNLNLGNPDKPYEFVADYEKLAAIYPANESTAPILQLAITRALDTTLSYFDQTSIYSESDRNAPPREIIEPERLVAPPPFPLANPVLPPPPAAPVLGDLSHPNPALYFIKNNDNKTNLRVDSAHPGEGWQRVEQFCSVLATHWLTKTDGNNLTFASLSPTDQQSAIETLVDQSSVGGGLPAQVQQARSQLGVTSDEKPDVVFARLAGEGYPAGTKIWFGNDRHAQAAIILPAGRCKIYDPNRSTTLPLLRQRDFATYLKDGGNNAFVVKIP